jgi:MFS superfamily sulfate permease-like transporter
MRLSPFHHFKSDLPAALVVFFVALPLCLGIALASGAPPMSGLIAGIIGGIVVGLLSKSPLGVSGPAAGLVAIVLTAIGDFGFQGFLLTVVVAGILQIVFGLIKAGVIAYFFPHSVISGMLTGIGLIIVLKQIPHFFGLDKDSFNYFSLLTADGDNTLDQIMSIPYDISQGATIVGMIALAILVFWQVVLMKRNRIFEVIQGPLVAVIIGILIYSWVKDVSYLSISGEQLVNVPRLYSWIEIKKEISFPDFGMIGNYKIWITGFTIALVASLETLLCVEATDRIDPYRRLTPTNLELIAQGVGNIAAGMIGGLPITQVIVRSSANIQSGGKTKAAAISHGFFILIAVFAIPSMLNMIPKSVLAAILLMVGYKLAKPSIFRQMWNLGWRQFVPFLITVVGILLGDLLIGIILGLAFCLILILYAHPRNPAPFEGELQNKEGHTLLVLGKEVTFFRKGEVFEMINSLPEGKNFVLDLRQNQFIDQDVVMIFDRLNKQLQSNDLQFSIITDQREYINPDSISVALR